MERQLGPSRLDEVLQPFLLAGMVLLTLGVAGIALTNDEPRSTRAIEILFVLLFFPSLFALMPYMGSIAAQAFGSLSFPLVGVRAAAAGCAGFAILIGLALSQPLDLVGGLLAIGAGATLIGLQIRMRRRPTRDAQH